MIREILITGMDGEGNVMYFDGSDSYYIGPDDVFYIDEAGRLMEY